MTERKAITDKIKVASLRFWGICICPECNEAIGPFDDVEWDHRQALIHGGAHDHTNIRPLHTTCHTQKTIRDVKANAKVKRIIRGKKPSKRKIKSAGFPKVSRPFPSRKRA